MPNTLLTFNVEDRRARAAFSRLQRELDQLDREFNQTRSEARETGEAIDALGDRARSTAKDVDRLGDVSQQSATHIDRLGTAAKRQNAVWQAVNGMLHDAHGRFVSAGQGAELFATAVGTVREMLTGLGAAPAAREIFAFGVASARAARQNAQATEQATRNAEHFNLTLAKLRADAEAQATSNAEHFSLALAKLRADAEETRDALNSSINPQQLVAGFHAALAASNAYYNARIANAQNAIAQETAGTEAYNTLQTRIFELGQHRLHAERQMTAENQRLLQQFSQERIDAANAASIAEVEGFQAATQAGKDYTDQLRQHINAIPNISSPDAPYGNAFTSQLRQDFEETERQGYSLLDVMRQLANYAFATDLDARLPDPIVRDTAIDARIAAEARGQQTLTDIRHAAGEQGRQFLNSVLRGEERDIQESINARAKQYQQFTTLVSKTFMDLATGRTQSFENVATAFVQQSLRIVLRAVVENQLLKRLDDTLTAAKIANINKIAAAQQAVSAGGLGGIAKLPGLGRVGGALSGGGLALGAASLLFPEQIKNLAGGITDTIGNLLSNVASVPDRAFGAQQVFLKIGEGEIKDITEIQRELIDEDRL